MTRKLLPFLFLFLFTKAFPQYHPMLTAGKSWDILYGDGSALCWHNKGYRFYVNGDTTISGTHYKVISSYVIFGQAGTPFCPPYYVDEGVAGWNYYFREDTTTQQVFYYDENAQQEYIQFDFSLNAGDTINMYGPGNGGIIDSTNFIMLANGATRKALYTGMYVYIESVGGGQGIFDPLFTLLGYWYNLICCSENGTFLYSGSFQPSCLATVGIDEKQKAEVRIYPNPATDILYMDNFEKGMVSIFNSEGAKILNTIANHSINIKNLNPGMYYLRLTDNEDIWSSKFVKIN